jgi:hypothetical protein
LISRIAPFFKANSGAGLIPAYNHERSGFGYARSSVRFSSTAPEPYAHHKGAKSKMFNLFDLDDRILAAAVAATGTIIGALIQLRIAWKKEVAERARGAPMTKKSRRGPVAAVLVLLVAAGVGGFAFSQSLVHQSERESAALRGELRTQLDQINATAARLELATMSERAQSRVDDARHAPQAATVTTTVGPCRTRAAAGANAAACSEQDAQRITLCASVPLSASVSDTVLYARPEDSTLPWSDSRVAPGQDIGRARFADKPIERSESDQTKLVCAGFSAWDSERAFSARLVVKFGGAAPSTPEVINAGAARPPEAPAGAAPHSAEAPSAPMVRPPEVTNPAVAPITAAAH